MQKKVSSTFFSNNDETHSERCAFYVTELTFSVHLRSASKNIIFRHAWKYRVSLLCIDDLLLNGNACDDGDDLGDDRRSETN